MEPISVSKLHNCFGHIEKWKKKKKATMQIHGLRSPWNIKILRIVVKSEMTVR